MRKRRRKRMTHEQRVQLGQELAEEWSSNEETMGEMAAYEVACSTLGISSDDGWDLLALVSDVNEEGVK